MPDIKINGFVSRPDFSKANRTFQTLVVNGRYVVSEEISYAVWGILREFLMARRYPMFVIYIDLPFDMLDVNVHPKKTEVKFVQAKRITSLVTQAINQDLFGIVKLDTPAVSASVTNVSTAGAPVPAAVVTPVVGFNADKAAESISFTQPLKEKAAFKRTMSEKPDRVNRFKDNTCAVIQNKNSKSTHEDDTVYIGSSYSVSCVAAESAEKTTAESVVITGAKELKKLGAIFETYIIIEHEDKVYLIDQHAAHERILYNKFKSALECGAVARQALLIPYSFSVSHADKAMLDEGLDRLFDCGFEVKAGGDLEYLIYSVPLVAAGLNLSDFVADLLNAKSNFDSLAALKESVIQSACKAAVKQGDKLSDSEIDALLFDMQSVESFCPHGRPIVLSLSKRDLEKLFKRVL